jgi:hypothetical protein
MPNYVYATDPYGNGTGGSFRALVPADLPPAAALMTLLASVFSQLPTTLPATSGVLWLNGGVIQLS